MLARSLNILVGIAVFLATAFFSYTYLGRTMGPQSVTLPPPVSSQKEASVLPTSASTKASKIRAVSSKTVIAPDPLRVPATSQGSTRTTLSVPGVIIYTNNARAQNGGLPALSENQTLDRDAQLKLEDMFNKQYFEHVSPTGVGPSDLADKVGYAYVMLGENLALGDFTSDNDLVTAWMNSPGHRANILNAHYQEIGVAVGKGMYEGRQTWLAVQSFGMPRSACPSINDELKVQIDTNNAAILTMKTALDTRKAQIDAMTPNDPNYLTSINQYNAIVAQYNATIETDRTLVANYNADINAFNQCIAAASARATVAE